LEPLGIRQRAAVPLLGAVQRRLLLPHPRFVGLQRRQRRLGRVDLGARRGEGRSAGLGLLLERHEVLGKTLGLVGDVLRFVGNLLCLVTEPLGLAPERHVSVARAHGGLKALVARQRRAHGLGLGLPRQAFGLQRRELHTHLVTFLPQRENLFA
jgi:hypothetical protein